jgi:hypothetical protein
MRSTIFYLLFYFHPLAKTIFSIVCRVFSLLSIVTLIAIFFNGFSIACLVSAAIFFAVSLGSLVLQEKYTTLLLKLQPDGIEYTFYT